MYIISLFGRSRWMAFSCIWRIMYIWMQPHSSLHCVWRTLANVIGKLFPSNNAIAPTVLAGSIGHPDVSASVIWLCIVSYSSSLATSTMSYNYLTNLWPGMIVSHSLVFSHWRPAIKISAKGSSLPRWSWKGFCFIKYYTEKLNAYISSSVSNRSKFSDCSLFQIGTKPGTWQQVIPHQKPGPDYLGRFSPYNNRPV